MSVKEMTYNERRTYCWLLNEIKTELDLQYRWYYPVASIIIPLVIAGMLMWVHWWYPIITTSTLVTIGGQMLAVYGGVIIATRAVWATTPTIALMCMARKRGNPRLFAELVRSTLRARIGVSYIMVGFGVQFMGTILPLIT